MANELKEVFKKAGFDFEEFGETTLKLTLDDIVEVKSYGGVYSTYSNAMMQMWGEPNDGFHNNCDYNKKNTLYGGLYDGHGHRPKIWRIVGIAIHEATGCEILCAIQDRMGRKLLIGYPYLKLKKHNPKNNKHLDVYQIKKKNEQH